MGPISFYEYKKLNILITDKKWFKNNITPQKLEYFGYVKSHSDLEKPVMGACEMSVTWREKGHVSDLERAVMESEMSQ